MKETDIKAKLPVRVYTNHLIDKIFDKYKINGTFLEIGCGTGDFLKKLEEKNLTGLGIDYSKEAVEISRSKLKSQKIKVEIADFLTLKKQKFNSIFCFEVIEHIMDDIAFLNHINMFLEKDGLLILTTPAKPEQFSKEDLYYGHQRRYTKRDLNHKLNIAGFSTLEFWSFSYLPYLFKPLIDRDQSTSKYNDMGERTKNSSFQYHPAVEKYVNLLYPIFSKIYFIFNIQDIFLNKDYGLHYLVVARKK